MNNTIDINNLHKQMVAGGYWLLRDTNDLTKNYAARNNLDVRQYRTPQKFIKRGEEIIIVSVSKEMWAGIKKYNTENIRFIKSEGTIAVLIEKGLATHIISVKDDYVNEEFIQKMVNTGYVTKDEFLYYSDPNNQDELPLIKTIVI